MKFAVVCSEKEFSVQKENVLKYIVDNKGEFSFLFNTGKKSVNCDETVVCCVENIYEYKNQFDCIVFLSIYNFTAARLVYQCDVRDVCIFHSDGYPVHLSNTSFADAKEQEYIASESYSKLKQLNRINMLLEYFNRSTVLRSFPLELQLESTSYCNAECIMCGHYVYKNAIARHMPPSLTKNLEKYLLYAETVVLHGNGEPFMQPDIVSLIGYYHSLGIKIATNTNLSILTDELAQLISRCFCQITVSIDGCTKETYEGIRQNLKFDHLLENIEKLNNVAPQLDKKIAVVACRQNLHELPDFIDFAAKHNFNSVNYIAMGSSVIAENKCDEIENYPVYSCCQFREVLRRAKNYGISVELPRQINLDIEYTEKQLADDISDVMSKPFFKDKSFQNELFDKNVKSRLEELKNSDDVVYSDYTASVITSEEATSLSDVKCCGCCDSLLARPYINLEGKVSPCCLRMKHYFGSIENDKSLSEIWNCRQMQELRECYYNGRVPSFCIGCSFMDNDFLKLGFF